MKKYILITILTLATNALAYDAYDYLEDYYNNDGGERRIQRENFQELIETLRDIEVRAAYPNDPAMWRYLNRNPRYRPYYLGE